jgi:hypothetical protein
MALPLPLAPGPWKCPACGGEIPTYAPGRIAEGEPLSRCAVCGGERFFVQRDFNQRIGCLVVVVGAALSPFTYGISLLVCLAIDLIIYLMVREVTLCYRCSAIYRGVARDPRHGAFDLHVADLDREERKYLERGI